MPDEERGGLSRAGEWVYPADILADSALSRADLATFGAWMKTLLHLWRERSASLSAAVAGWARLWSCSEDEAARILSQLAELQIADVTRGDGGVTVTCRRLLRRERSRQLNAERMRIVRSRAERAGDAAGTFDVHHMNKKGTSMGTVATAGADAKDAIPEAPDRAKAEDRRLVKATGDGDAKLERFNRLWWLCRSGTLKELMFRKGGLKAKVLDASPEAITVEYPHASLSGRKCRALLLPPEVDLVQESEN